MNPNQLTSGDLLSSVAIIGVGHPLGGSGLGAGLHKHWREDLAELERALTCLEGKLLSGGVAAPWRQVLRDLRAAVRSMRKLIGDVSQTADAAAQRHAFACFVALHKILDANLRKLRGALRDAAALAALKPRARERAVAMLRRIEVLGGYAGAQRRYVHEFLRHADAVDRDSFFGELAQAARAKSSEIRRSIVELAGGKALTAGPLNWWLLTRPRDLRQRALDAMLAGPCHPLFLRICLWFREQIGDLSDAPNAEDIIVARLLAALVRHRGHFTAIRALRAGPCQSDLRARSLVDYLLESIRRDVRDWRGATDADLKQAFLALQTGRQAQRRHLPGRPGRTDGAAPAPHRGPEPASADQPLTLDAICHDPDSAFCLIVALAVYRQLRGLVTAADTRAALPHGTRGGDWANEACSPAYEAPVADCDEEDGAAPTPGAPPFDVPRLAVGLGLLLSRGGRVGWIWRNSLLCAVVGLRPVLDHARLLGIDPRAADRVRRTLKPDQGHRPGHGDGRFIAMLVGCRGPTYRQHVRRRFKAERDLFDRKLDQDAEALGAALDQAQAPKDGVASPLLKQALEAALPLVGKLEEIEALRRQPVPHGQSEAARLERLSQHKCAALAARMELQALVRFAEQLQGREAGAAGDVVGPLAAAAQRRTHDLLDWLVGFHLMKQDRGLATVLQLHWWARAWGCLDEALRPPR